MRFASFGFVILSLSACGGSGGGGMKMLNLHTGFETTASKNLLTEISQIKSLSGGTQACLQNNVFAAVQLQQDGPFLSYPVHAISDSGASSTFGNDSSAWLRNHFQIDLVSVPVPTGQTIEVGLVGALVNPANVLADGSCAAIVPSTSSALDTISMLGHKKIMVTANQDSLDLNLWALFANTIPAATGTSTVAGASNACNDQDDHNLCPSYNFMKFSVPAIITNPSVCGLNSLRVKLEYFQASNRPEHVVQYFNFTNSTLSYSIPDIDSISLSIEQSVSGTNSSNTVWQGIYNSKTSQSNAASNASNVPFTYPGNCNGVFTFTSYH